MDIDVLISYVQSWFIGKLIDWGFGRFLNYINRRIRRRQFSSTAQEIASAFDIYSNPHLNYTQILIPSIGKIKIPEIIEIEQARNGVIRIFLQIHHRLPESICLASQ